MMRTLQDVVDEVVALRAKIELQDKVILKLSQRIHANEKSMEYGFKHQPLMRRMRFPKALIELGLKPPAQREAPKT